MTNPEKRIKQLQETIATEKAKEELYKKELKKVFNELKDLGIKEDNLIKKIGREEKEIRNLEKELESDIEDAEKILQKNT